MNLIEKLGLYDILAMLIPGFLLLQIAEKTLKPEVVQINDDMLRNILYVIACYAVGLVWHKLMELLFYPLRNHPLLLGWAKNWAETESACKVTTPYVSEQGIVSQYYTAYYRLGVEKSLGAVPLVEKQTAFLQNTMFLLPLFFVMKKEGVDWSIPCCEIIILFIAWLVVGIVALVLRCRYAKSEVEGGCCAYVLLFLLLSSVVAYTLLGNWCYISMVAALLLTYLLLHFKVCAMVWEADAYLKPKPSSPQP